MCNIRWLRLLQGLSAQPVRMPYSIQEPLGHHAWRWWSCQRCLSPNSPKHRLYNSSMQCHPTYRQFPRQILRPRADKIVGHSSTPPLPVRCEDMRCEGRCYAPMQYQSTAADVYLETAHATTAKR